MFLKISNENNNDVASSNYMDVVLNLPHTTFFCMFSQKQAF